MPDYEASLFDPPAPAVRVVLRNPDAGTAVSDVLLLLDTGNGRSRRRNLAGVGSKAKAYQVKQVRNILVKCRLGECEERIETARELGRPIPEPKGRLMYA